MVTEIDSNETENEDEVPWTLWPRFSKSIPLRKWRSNLWSPQEASLHWLRCNGGKKRSRKIGTLKAIKSWSSSEDAKEGSHSMGLIEDLGSKNWLNFYEALLGVIHFPLSWSYFRWLVLLMDGMGLTEGLNLNCGHMSAMTPSESGPKLLHLSPAASPRCDLNINARIASVNFSMDHAEVETRGAQAHSICTKMYTRETNGDQKT